MADDLCSKTVKLYQPQMRFLIPIENFHTPRKLLKIFKKNSYTFKINKNFENVILQCQTSNRKEKKTWINDIIYNSYVNLNQNKMCHSVECYDEEELIAGLYGVHIGSCFFGESMFSKITNASKFCLLYLIAILKKNKFCILDSQYYNKHLTQFGAYEIENYKYLIKMKKKINDKTSFDFVEDFQEVLSLLQPRSQRS